MIKKPKSAEQRAEQLAEGKRLRAWRNAKHFSQDSMAALVSINLSAYQKMEAGRTRISHVYLLTFVKVLGIRYEQIRQINGGPKDHPPPQHK